MHTLSGGAVGTRNEPVHGCSAESLTTTVPVTEAGIAAATVTSVSLRRVVAPPSTVATSPQSPPSVSPATPSTSIPMTPRTVPGCAPAGVRAITIAVVSSETVTTIPAMRVLDTSIPPSVHPIDGVAFSLPHARPDPLAHLPSNLGASAPRWADAEAGPIVLRRITLVADRSHVKRALDQACTPDLVGVRSTERRFSAWVHSPR